MTTSPSPSANTVPSLLAAAQGHLDQGHTEPAAQCLEQVLVLEPKNAPALRALAEIAVQNKKLLDAWKYGVAAAQALPTIPNIVLLANISKKLGHPHKALRYYTSALKAAPNDVAALSGIAEAYEDLGYRTRAIEALEKVLAITPHALAPLDRLTKLYAFSNSPRLFELYQRARPPESAPLLDRLKFQYQLTVRREAAERVKRGMPPYALSPDDLFFQFAQEERNTLEAIVDAALAQNPAEVEGLHYKGYTALARGALKEAEESFHACVAHNPTSMYRTIFFTDAFYRQLENIDPEALLQRLPPLVDVTNQTFDTGAVIFLSCDIRYFFRFARPLLSSIDDVAPGSQVHIHIMNGTDEELLAAATFCAARTKINVAISAEDARPLTTDKKTAVHYFHAIRFIRMYQYLLTYRRPLWLMDVDALMNRDPRPVLEAPDNADVMLFGHAGRWQPWFQFNASTVGIQPTVQGAHYLRLVASYIGLLHTDGRMWWGIDQLALYGVFAFLRGTTDGPRVKMLPPHLLDGDYTPEGIIWGNGTTAKFRRAPAEAGLSEPPDSPHMRYLAALEKYAPPSER